jgi:hypothetical protein
MTIREREWCNTYGHIWINLYNRPARRLFRKSYLRACTFCDEREILLTDPRKASKVKT